jgi:hypothetical protein
MSLPEPRRDSRGFIAAPVLYPRFALDAMVAFEQPDAAGQEAPHFVGGRAVLPLIDEEQQEDGRPEAGLDGWLVQYDSQCWVFVPYVDEIEQGCALRAPDGVVQRVQNYLAAPEGERPALQDRDLTLLLLAASPPSGSAA